MLQLNGSSDELDSQASVDEMTASELKDLQEAQEELKLKIEKRADLLAEALQTVISLRKPFSKASDPIKSKFGYKNDPFRKNQSYNSLL